MWLDIPQHHDDHPLANLSPGTLFGPFTGYAQTRLPWLSSFDDTSNRKLRPDNMNRKILARAGPHKASGYTSKVISIACPSFGPRLVAKVFRPDVHPNFKSDIVATASEANRALAHERNLYEGPLQPLHGQCVPRWYGLFGGRLDVAVSKFTRVHDVWIAIMEDAGPACQWDANDA